MTVPYHWLKRPNWIDIVKIMFITGTLKLGWE